MQCKMVSNFQFLLSQHFGYYIYNVYFKKILHIHYKFETKFLNFIQKWCWLLWFPDISLPTRTPMSPVTLVGGSNPMSLRATCLEGPGMFSVKWRSKSLWRKGWTIQSFAGWMQGERRTWSLGNVCRGWESLQVRSKLTKVKVIAWQIKFRFNLDHHGHLSVCKISFFTSKNLSPCPVNSFKRKNIAGLIYLYFIIIKLSLTWRSFLMALIKVKVILSSSVEQLFKRGSACGRSLA